MVSFLTIIGENSGLIGINNSGGTILNYPAVVFRIKYCNGMVRPSLKLGFDEP